MASDATLVSKRFVRSTIKVPKFPLGEDVVSLIFPSSVLVQG
jgi:hypothetical protein